MDPGGPVRCCCPESPGCLCDPNRPSFGVALDKEKVRSEAQVKVYCVLTNTSQE